MVANCSTVRRRYIGGGEVVREECIVGRKNAPIPHNIALDERHGGRGHAQRSDRSGWHHIEVVLTGMSRPANVKDH